MIMRMNPLFSVAEIRAIERSAALELMPGTLMRRAGQVAAAAALQLMPAASGQARVLVLAGPGNNGGDALETAARLAHAGLQVTLLHLAGAGPHAPEALEALQRAHRSAVHFEDPALAAAPAAPIWSRRWSLVIDGLFGIGLQRALTGSMRALAEAVNRLACPVLALDVPSGLDADTGAIVGPLGIAVRATHTVTFIGDKPGLHTCDGRDHAGTVQVARLEIDTSHFPPAQAHLNQIGLFSQHLAARRHNSHKGSFGDVAVVGGARGMAGAAVLAARAALFSGAGRVFVGFVDDAPGYDSAQPELMFRSAGALDFCAQTLVVGCGMGATRAAGQLLETALASTRALVLDADALNLIAADRDLEAQLAQRTGATILTPHPLEAARLLGVNAAQVQSDRLKAARQLAARMNATVVLKGSGSVLAAPSGKVVVNPTGNPALATAGTGDILAGLCGSLLAQGWPQWEAALAAVWVHGTAADRLVADGTGPIGLTAGELPAALRLVLNRLLKEAAGGPAPAGLGH
jgi:ADP-dependent NAD(P)H-hydrate dehydratase / NAD(P)H-hydrate epimerase